MNKLLKKLIFFGVGTVIVTSNYFYYHDRPIYASVYKEKIEKINLEHKLREITNPLKRVPVQNEINRKNQTINSLNNKTHLPEWIYMFSL